MMVMYSVAKRDTVLSGLSGPGATVQNTHPCFQGRENSPSWENWTGFHTSLESAGKTD